ncbi:ABC transporter substrate-binding protein [Paenibacillus caui]|uniref:ABC transporter substrate-binding protein n=1 Tax=Paenibacillus caui TaxID=2873927 RepID=UPI001CA80164|nr:ABC transporter substrate-binding protein [Paenibacillus caui]
MKLESQFLKLHESSGGQQSLWVTLDELAAVFECTHRNALNIVKRMEAEEWISWTPSRGRGRRSSLSFLAQPETIAVQAMMQAMDRRDVRYAVDQIKVHADTAELKEKLQGWLLTYFGHHTQVREDKQIDMLRLPVRQKLHTIDPLYMNLLAESFVSSHVYDGLVKRSDQDGIRPHLAHAWDVDESRTRWSFYLRKQVLFHNGTVLTAADVVHTFERLIGSPQRTLYRPIIQGIKSVRALHPSVVLFELKEPNELFLPFLGTSRAAIVLKGEELPGKGGFGVKPAGTGPFKITEMTEERFVLEVYNYHFQGRAHLDRVEIIYVPWSEDSTDSLPEQQSPFHIIHSAESSGHGAWSRIHSEASVCKFITVNSRKTGPLQDPDFRKAVLSVLRTTGVPDSLSGDARNPRNQSSAPLKIATIAPYRQEAEQLAELLGDNGYPSTVNAVSPEQFKGAVRLEADLILFSLMRDQDEQLRLFDLFETIAKHAETGIMAYIEHRLQRIAREPDPIARMEQFRTIESKLIRECHLHILYEKPFQTASLPSIRGVAFNSQGWIDLRKVWFPPDL